MDEDRPKHPVSVKVALIDPKTKRVLVTMLINGNHGLPGGHVEYDEQPDEAIAREIYEELGVKDVLELQQRAFWKDLKAIE